MKFLDPHTLTFLGWISLLFPITRAVFARPLFLRAAVSWSVLNVIACAALVVITGGWDPTMEVLQGRWSWPVLDFPAAFVSPNLSLLLAVKIAVLFLIWNTRHVASAGWWIAVDGGLSLVLSCANIQTFFAIWQITAFAALFCTARSAGPPTDLVSTDLKRLTVVFTVSIAILGFALVGYSLPQAESLCWLALSVLSFGSVYQAMESQDRSLRRAGFVAAALAFAFPATLLAIRLAPDSSVDGLAPLLVAAVAFGGFTAFQANSFDTFLKGTFIACQATSILACALMPENRSAYRLVHFVPLVLLGVLNVRIPLFLQMTRTGWIACLEGPARKVLATFCVSSLVLLLASMPFGFTDFAFAKLLEISWFWSAVFCLGLLGSVAGCLTVLVAYWFSDSFLRWPTKNYTLLARRYFGV